jgi:hypothetical protein
MKNVVLDDIMGLAAYEKARDSFRQRVIELKKKRRVSLGDKISLVFENRDTVIFQIQEMLRAERITDLEKIREEIEVYNALIPKEKSLSATLFLEIEDQRRLREELLAFLGVEESLFLDLGSRRLRARFEEGRSKEDKISAVHYVGFNFGDDDVRAFAAAGTKATLIVDHPNYRAEAEILEETRRELAEDLRS